MTTTHTLEVSSAHRRLRNIQPIPVSLIGTHELTDEDQDTVAAALTVALNVAAPDAQNLGLVWRPSGRTVDVWADGPTLTKRVSRIKLATVAVRSLR